jgi:hypothetical protein
MSNDKIDPTSKDPKISSADDLAKTTNKSDVELSEEELKRVSAGTPSSGGDRPTESLSLNFAKIEWK